MWERALRRPVWPLRFGRSQDLASARTGHVELADGGTGLQRQALVPAEATVQGTLLRLPTAITEDRARTRWDAYRYANTGADRNLVPADYVTSGGQALFLLPPSHPSLISADAS